MTVVPNIRGTLGIVSKRLAKELVEFEIWGSVRIIIKIGKNTELKAEVTKYIYCKLILTERH